MATSKPVAEPIVATEGTLLLQVPPEVGSVQGAVLPWQMCDGPEIGVRAKDAVDIKKAIRNKLKRFIIVFF